MGGAYCYSVTPTLTPYVMLNFTGEARDIATMAHELGHAVHAMMAEQHNVFTFHSTLPLAETASVFGERILSDALMLLIKSVCVSGCVATIGRVKHPAPTAPRRRAETPDTNTR